MQPCELMCIAHFYDTTVICWLVQNVTIDVKYLLQKWPEAEFHVVPGAGHFHTEPGIQAKIMEAAKKYEQLQ